MQNIPRQQHEAGLPVAVLVPEFEPSSLEESMTAAAEESVPSVPSSSTDLAISIGRNTLFGVIAKLAQVGTRLITIPIVIAHLGLAGYGIWSIIMTIAAYMRFGTFGIKSAFQQYVAAATGNRDFDTVNKLLSTGCAGMVLLSALLFPVAYFADVLARAAGVPPAFLIPASKSIATLALIMILSNVGAVYESVVLGGHRIDLARNFATFFTVAEAIAIVICLHVGQGLVAMSVVMASSEVLYVGCCFVAGKRILPQISVSRKFVTTKVVPELIRFAGSYQLVSILEVLYLSILPVTVLRAFGADASGVYAIATRLTTSALMLWEAILLPILSGGAMLHASGSGVELRRLIRKSFKLTLGVCLFPLASIALLGPTLVFAWTGQSDPLIAITSKLVCLAGLFTAFSSLCLVLYRSSGRALHDNIRQLVRIVVLLSIVVFAGRLGFRGVLFGLSIAEFIGMLFMMFGISKTLDSFHPRDIYSDLTRITVAVGMVLLMGAIAVRLPLPLAFSPRMGASIDLAKFSLACLLSIWPALRITKALSHAERHALTCVLAPENIGGLFGR